MSPELAARIAADTRTLADTLGVEPDRAEAAVRWMQSRGWRLHTQLADPPAPARRATPEVQRQAMAEIRAALSRRPEEARR